MPKVVGQDDSIFVRHTCPSCGAINEVYPGEIVRLETIPVYGTDKLKFWSGFICAGCDKKVYTKFTQYPLEE